MHLICGEALYDVFIEGGEGAIDVALRATAGGSPFNVAVGLARLNVQAALATDLATDMLGNRLAQMLLSEGVDDRFLRRTAPGTALALVATDENGTPSYSFLGLEHGNFAPQRTALSVSIPDIVGFHVGSVALVMPRSAEGLLELARDLANQALVSFDPNVRLSIEPDVAKWQTAIEQHRLLAHVIKVSEEDIHALYGRSDANRICQGWLNERTAMVILTRGTGGASFFGLEHGRVDIPAFKTATVDTIGAGDSFMAAVLAVLSGWELRTSDVLRTIGLDELHSLGRFAAAAASITCSRRGPSLPKLAEIEALVPLPRRV